MPIPETETLSALVARVFRVDDVTLGEPARGLIARYRGRLLSDDSTSAYEQLKESLGPYGVTPLFRMDGGEQQVIYLVPGAPKPRQPNPWVNLAFFIATLISVLFTGAVFAFPGDPNIAPGLMMKDSLLHMGRGWPFAASILAILLAHEFGHYIAGRLHHTAVTLPYFIPVPYPLSFLGTLGAFIQLKEHPKNKRILFDIGVAGPLAGMLVALPVLLYGLSLSDVSTVSGHGVLEGNSIVYLLAKLAVFHKFLPAPSSYHGLSPVSYWILYFFSGRPLPLGGADVMLNPVAWAGWAGLLVTAMNLVPVGTLDGGHILYALVGERAKASYRFIMVLLVLLGLVWTGWWLWAILLFTLGRVHAEPLDQITPLDPPRQALAIFALILFILVFTPVPLVQY
jgi:membrane-associated protease RseP (regulator of RpoE activity)